MPQRTAAEPIPLIVDFDNPHVGANVPLRGQYPSGVIDWGRGEWKVCPPGGRMSTFSLCAVAAKKAQFRFFHPRILMRLDVYNPLGQEVVLTIRAPEMREVTFTLKPGALQRIKTGWMNRAWLTSRISPGAGGCVARLNISSTGLQSSASRRCPSPEISRLPKGPPA